MEYTFSGRCAKIPLYGSRVREDHRPDSDLDVYVSYEPDSGFSLIELSQIALLIEDETGIKVHITTENSLHPRLRDRIEAEAIQIL